MATNCEMVELPASVKVPTVSANPAVSNVPPLIVTAGDTQLTNTLGMAAGWAISLAVAERSIRAARSR